MQTGFFKDAGGSLYHSDGSGAMTGGGWNLIGNTWYCKWYYLDEKTGVMQTGFFKDAGGSLYHSDGSGAMTGGGWNLIGNTWYWMHDNGVIFRGWLRHRSDADRIFQGCRRKFVS